MWKILAAGIVAVVLFGFGYLIGVAGRSEAQTGSSKPGVFLSEEHKQRLDETLGTYQSEFTALSAAYGAGEYEYRDPVSSEYGMALVDRAQAETNRNARLADPNFVPCLPIPFVPVPSPAPAGSSVSGVGLSEDQKQGLDEILGTIQWESLALTKNEALPSQSKEKQVSEESQKIETRRTLDPCENIFNRRIDDPFDVSLLDCHKKVMKLVRGLEIPMSKCQVEFVEPAKVAACQDRMKMVMRAMVECQVEFVEPAKVAACQDKVKKVIKAIIECQVEFVDPTKLVACQDKIVMQMD